jgi:hypothetical protein
MVTRPDSGSSHGRGMRIRIKSEHHNIRSQWSVQYVRLLYIYIYIYIFGFHPPEKRGGKSSSEPVKERKIV